MLICSQCRFENPPSNRFCQVCGSPLQDEGIAEAEVTPSSSTPAIASEAPPSDSPWSVITEEIVKPEERPVISQGEAEQHSLADGFATIPPSQIDCHQSLKGASADLGASEAPANDTQELKPIVSSGQEPLDAMVLSHSYAVGRDIPDGLVNATAAPSQTAPIEEPDSHAAEESWDEATVWTGADDSGDDDLPTVVLPMQLARLDSAGFSHVGRQRDHNEDNFNIQTEIFTTSGLAGHAFSAKGLYILCDGMGGHSGGEVASAMVVAELKRYFAEHWQTQFPSEDMIRGAIASANQVVYDANESDERLGNSRMGTTLVLVLIDGTQVAFAHVGDSRLYTYSRRQGLLQRTIDHEVGQLEVMRGVDPEIAYGRPESYQLTQALGPKDSDYVNPGLEFIELQEDTLFLLCSDGLSDYSLIEDHGEEKVAPLLGSQAVLEQGVNDLVHLANELSGHDNITAVAIRAKVRPDSKALS